MAKFGVIPQNCFLSFWSNFSGKTLVEERKKMGMQWSLEKIDQKKKSGTGDGAKKGIMKINW